MTEKIKTLIQCDFDGTVTRQDGSFVLLDVFSDAVWRPRFHEYEEGRVSVGEFNAEAFSHVKADKETLLGAIRRAVKTRPGFTELVELCRRKDFRFVIVSNGLRFYIDDILERLGLEDIEVHAAETEFSPDGLKVKYLGPDGNILNDDFKLAYNESFQKAGYRVIYIGNGGSDMDPARESAYVFATESLTRHCRWEGVPFTHFRDHTDIIPVLETL